MTTEPQEYRVSRRPEHKWHVEWFEDGNRCFIRYEQKEDAEQMADKLRSQSLDATVYPMRLAQ